MAVEDTGPALNDLPVLDGRVRLARLRRSATGVLAGLAAVFAGTMLINDPPGWVLLLRAISEAGMVGGLADWFAVEAIFRHPLRIPIPHTALLRTRKDDAADNIGRFFQEYILVPEQMAGTLARLNPARRIGSWAAERDNAAYSANMLMDGLAAVVTHDNPRLNDKIHVFLRDRLADGRTGSKLNHLLADFARHAVRGQGFDGIVAGVEEHLDANRDGIESIVHEHSRWWIAGQVDQRIAGLIVDAVLGILRDIRQPGSEMRAAFEKTVATLVTDLEHKGELSAILSGAGDEEIDRLAEKMGDAARELLSALLGGENAGARQEMAEVVTEAIQSAGDFLLNNPEAEAALNQRVADIAFRMAEANRHLLGQYAADTLKSWDTDLLIERFEVEVGPDLQFVRINGAVLGSVIGGVIFAIETLIGA